MIYAGVYCTSQVPKSCVDKELSHSETVNGKIVQYWHVWVKEPGEGKPPFKDDQLDKKKVKELDDYLRSDFFKED